MKVEPALRASADLMRNDHTATLALDVLDVLDVLRIVLEAGNLTQATLGCALRCSATLRSSRSGVRAKRQGLDALEEHPRVIGDWAAPMLRSATVSMRSLYARGRAPRGGRGPIGDRLGGVRGSRAGACQWPVETTFKCGNGLSEGQQESVQVLETKGKEITEPKR